MAHRCQLMSYLPSFSFGAAFVIKRIFECLLYFFMRNEPVILDPFTTESAVSQPAVYSPGSASEDFRRFCNCIKPLSFNLLHP